MRHEVAVDPGLRIVRLIQGERELDVEEVEVHADKPASVQLDFPLGARAHGEQLQLAEQWWLWTLVGIAVAGVAVGAAASFALRDDGTATAGSSALTVGTW